MQEHTPGPGPQHHGEHVPGAAHRALADHLNDLVVFFDTEGRCVDANRTARRILRLDAQGPVDFTLADLPAPAEQERFDAVVEQVRGGTHWTGALSVLSARGSEFPTRSTLTSVELDGSPGIGWVAKDTTTDRDVIRTLRERAFYDPLTGLSHRSLFLDRLDLLLRRIGDRPRPVAVLFLTPDRFKEKVNRFESGTGDRLLKAIATRVPGALAADQSMHRWGDADFVVLCEQIDGEAGALGVAAAIREAFAEPFLVGDAAIFLSASIGVALAHPGDATTDQVIRHADAAGQLAKQAGGGSIRLFDEELRVRATRRAELEDALRGADRRGELILYYQPEIELRTNRIVACEALVRWRHPEWGLVSPGEFIPVAEASNLILDVGAWVLHEALRQGTCWARQFPEREPVTVAVNISAKQFALDDFVDQVAAELASTGADPKHVCLEITESVLIDDAEAMIQKLNDLKALGVHLAIDDFGTGYSSLAYLRRFPVDILKVDQSFVSGLGHDPEDSAIVQAVVHMGQALHMTTLAEGVETAHHVIELRELSCDIAQGYHFARPVTAEEFGELLELGDDWLQSSTG